MLLALKAIFPEKGIVQRLSGYLNEMYPLIPRALTASIMFISYTLFISDIQKQGTDFLSVYTVVGIWSLFALALILRLMDELKDKELDSKLFKNRPLPSGRVFESDIIFGLILVIVLFIISHSFSYLLFESSIVVLTYTLLMLKYFFVTKKHHSNLLLNLATHNPVVIFFLFHIMIIYKVQHSIAFSSLQIIPLILVSIMFWFLFLSWEIARKIRYEHEETEYITYSKILGTNKAGILAFIIQTISFVLAVYFYKTLSFSFIFIGIIFLGYIFLIKTNFLFFTHRISQGINLKKSAEQYVTIFMSAIVIEYLVRMV